MVRTIGDLGVMGRLIAGAARNQAQAWADRTCAEQGLSAKISDGRTLATVATLLGAVGLDPPERRQARGIKDVTATDGRPDPYVVEHRGDDRVLPAKRERRPPRAEVGAIADEPVQR